MMFKTVLLCDISNGKTLKLALCHLGEKPDIFRSYVCREKAQFEEILTAYLMENGNPDLFACAISASGWETEGRINLVHYGFEIEREALKELLGVRRLHLVNDCVAKAMAIPEISQSQAVKICGQHSLSDQNKVIVSPSTGFGTAFLTSAGDGTWIATHCEAAHASFAPSNCLELKILEAMMQLRQYVSREAFLSFTGFITLWEVLLHIEAGAEDQPNISTVEEIIGMAYLGNALALKVIKTWIEMLASNTADIALTTGARGGVYLNGELIEILGELFDVELFAKHFINKGIATGLLEEIEVFTVKTDNLAMIGLMTLFEDD